VEQRRGTRARSTRQQQNIIDTAAGERLAQHSQSPVKTLPLSVGQEKAPAACQAQLLCTGKPAPALWVQGRDTQALRVQPRQQRAAARLITCWRRRAERPGQTAAPTKTCRDSQAQKQIEGLTGKRCVKDTGRVDVDVPAPPAGLFTLDSCRLPAAVRKCQRHSLRRLCLCSAICPGAKTCVMTMDLLQ
jgi:hypothetical protein